MTFKPILATMWLTTACISGAAIWFAAPSGERAPQLIGFVIGMAFWGAWRLGDVMARR